MTIRPLLIAHILLSSIHALGAQNQCPDSSTVSTASQKIAKYKNSSSARALRMLLTACNLPQRASSCPVCPECLSSVGLSNSLLVGRITNRVNRMTPPSRIPATSHQPPECRPSGPCCDGGQ
jgi:hypothetical protein